MPRAPPSFPRSRVSEIRVAYWSGVHRWDSLVSPPHSDQCIVNITFRLVNLGETSMAFRVPPVGGYRSHKILCVQVPGATGGTPPATEGLQERGRPSVQVSAGSGDPRRARSARNRTAGGGCSTLGVCGVLSHRGEFPPGGCWTSRRGCGKVGSIASHCVRWNPTGARPIGRAKPW
jgi:hypothetical protein